MFKKKITGNKSLNLVTLFFIIFVFVFTVIFVRLLIIYFQINLEKYVKVNPNNRGVIYAQNKNVLAYTDKKYNLYCNPKKIEKSLSTNNSVGKIIASVLEIPLEEVNKKIKKEKTFLIKRYADKEHYQKIMAVQSSSILVDNVFKRIYPEGQSLAKTLGFSGYDAKGLYGLELYYDDFLSFKENSRFLSKTIHLSILLGLQKKIERQLIDYLQKIEASKGIVIVQDVETKRIVSLVNLPHFNPNKFLDYKSQIFANEAVSSAIEPGSIVKIFFTAYLLEKEKIALTNQFYCEGYYEINEEERIKCSRKHGLLDIKDILRYSCNTGIIKACESLKDKEIDKFLKNLSVGETIGIDLPAENRGILPPVQNWDLRTRALIPIGHGINLTLIQVINLFSTLISDGVLYSPKIANTLEWQESIHEQKKTKVVSIEPLRPLVSVKTVNRLLPLLKASTGRGSTGYLAQKGNPFGVIGKTSTSQIITKKERRTNDLNSLYSIKKYNAMFTGAIPAADPKYSILIFLEKPKKHHSGGRSAAPLFVTISKLILEEGLLTLDRQTIINSQSGYQPKVKNYNFLYHNRVPDFKGQSLREALITLDTMQNYFKNKKIQLKYQIEGNGYVLKQIPPPDRPITNRMTIFLKLTQ